MFAANNSAAPSGAVFIEDVFSSYVFSGTGASLTLTDNVDRTKGALDIFKGRSGATDWAWYDTARGVGNDLASNSTAAATTQAQGVTAVSTTGITIGTLAKINTSGATYVKHTFREAAKFFRVTTKSHTNGAASTVDLSSLGTVGLVYVKRTDSTSNWMAWHRSLGAGNLLYLNLTNAQTADSSISVSGTTLTIASTVATGTYSIMALAHDTSVDGLIQCGTYTGNGSATGPEINLGWEPQLVLAKYAGGTALTDSTTGNWFMSDSMRSMSMTESKTLSANTSGAEGSGNNLFNPTPTGFKLASEAQGVNNSGSTYIYLAIRRGPMRKPTSGTQVYQAVARTGTATSGTQITGVGFAPDLSIIRKRTSTSENFHFDDRLRGGSAYLASNSTAAEFVLTSAVQSFNMDGITVGTESEVNGNGASFINWFFRRTAGVFDISSDTGTGVAHTISHNLTVAPELMIRKSRSGATQWEVWCSAIANTEKLVLNSTAAKATDTTAWNSTAPTATSFTVGTGANVNTNGATYITYLMASLAGISKVGSFVGNGGTQTINCGFAAGARMVMIKRLDGAGDFYLWDSVRGIVASTDPHLSLNTTAAEVTTDDSVDPDASGFIVNQLSDTNINVNAATYVYWALA